MFRKRTCCSKHKLKRESLPFSNANIKAVATLEAVLIIPIVFTVMFFFIWIIDIFRIHAQIGEVVNDLGKEMVEYSYPYSILMERAYDDSNNNIIVPDIFSDVFLTKSIMNCESYGRIRNLNCFFSDITDKKEIKLIATYTVKPYMDIPGVSGIKLTNVFYSKAYVGTTFRIKEETVYVYITKNSEVYHTSLDCRSIKNSVDETSMDNIANKRNKNGAKYYPCIKCTNHPDNGVVYYTPYGNRYHCDEGCPDLNTSVTKISIDEVGDKRKCRFCP